MDKTLDSGGGFFGKVTSHGDFVSRRLPPLFLQTWDGWLQSALHASRGQLGTAWLGSYLSSPIWRFALAPGVCGANAWAGLLMPSVDRVGRHFPLTIAAGVAGDAPLLDWMTKAGPWYDRLEDLALWSLQADFALEVFDEALRGVSAPAGRTSGQAPRGGVSGEYRNRVHAVAGLDLLSTVIANLDPAPANQSLWWTDGSEVVAPCVLQCKGLPAAAGFAAMLDGQWAAHGWQA
jgi:type VI secretion system protein ImpM